MGFNYQTVHTTNPEFDHHQRMAELHKAAIYAGMTRWVGRAVAAAVRGLAGRIRAMIRERRTLRALSALSERELADIGLSPAEITAVARAAATQGDASGITLEGLRRAKIVSAPGPAETPAPLPAVDGRWRRLAPVASGQGTAAPATDRAQAAG